MHAHALIIAALSASALAGISLTAHDPSDYNCANTPIGHQIDLSGSECAIYVPEKPDAYIYAVFVADKDDEIAYNISIFSDPNCGNHIADIAQNSTTVNEGGYSNCYSMDSIAKGPWGSAKIGNAYF